MSATVKVFPPKRGPAGNQQVEGELKIQSATITWSWGSQPSPSSFMYVASSTYPRIDAGAWLELVVYGQKFWGVTRKGTSLDSAGNVLPTERGPDGHVVQIDFVDPRVYLQWDYVWGMFNMEDVRVIDGERIKQYWHILPIDARIGRRTYTVAPLKVEQIINFLLGADTVETLWETRYHNDQVVYPIYNVDYSGGRRLDQALAELSEEQGLVFTIMDKPFQLVWTRKGFDSKGGQAVTIPGKYQRRAVSNQLSDAPSRVWVTGDRNRYLVLDVTLTPDWNRNFEELARKGGLDGLAADLFTNTAAYNAIAGDTEHAEGWLLAAAKAKEISVREYAALREARAVPKDFNDFRLYGGRARMDMPVALYLSEIVFRAYRPPAAVQIGAASIELRSLKIASEMFARVTHDVATGAMTASVITDDDGRLVVEQPGMGNGFVIVQGLSLDPAHLMEFFSPERFVPAAWQNATSLWRPMSFQADDSGEDGPFVLLDEPAWLSGDVFRVVNGHGVLNANPTLTPASVKAALCFEADRFRLAVGASGGRDVSLSVPAIRREVVVKQSAVIGEVIYGDGKTADEKAEELASSVLGMPFIYLNGSYRYPLNDNDVAPTLDGMLSKIVIEYAPGGRILTVEFASERGKRAYTPDKDLDRATRMDGMFAGQRELRALAATDRFQAMSARQTRGLLAQQVSGLLRGRGGVEGRQGIVTVQNGSGVLPVGTPIWRGPLQATTATAPGTSQTESESGSNVTLKNTQAVMPAAVTDNHSILAGVVMRDEEDPKGQLRVCEHGKIPARVKGPVSAGDTIGRVNGQDYFGKVNGDVVNKSNGEAVGRVEQDVESGKVKLVRVWLGVGGGSGGDASAVWG